MAEAGSFADRVKQQADIVRVVGEYVSLRKSGQSFVGLCPFHSEKTPSFSVHPVRQFYYCFGCSASGDIFKFIMEMEKCEFPEAVRSVAEKCGIPVPAPRQRSAEERRSTERRSALVEMHREAAAFFTRQLNSSAEGKAAHAYLEDRGLDAPAIEHFGLGYAPSGGDALLRVLKQKFPEKLIEQSGLAARDQQGRLYDRFRRRVIFPIANETGKIVAFGGRALGDEAPKYLNSPETPIYSKGAVLYHLDRAKEPIRRAEFAVLVEGYMDTIGVARAGILNVVASCGTSLTETQVKLLSRFSRRIVVNYDPDSAGQGATERSFAPLLQHEFEVRVLALPPVDGAPADPDSFIQKKGAEAYRELLFKAPMFLDYLIGRAQQMDLRTAEAKLRAVNFLMPHVQRVPNALLRSEWATRIAQRLGVDEPVLREAVRKAAAERRGEVQARPELIGRSVRPAERRLLQNLLVSDEFRRRLAQEISAGALHQELETAGIFRALLSVCLEGRVPDPAALASSLEESERRLLFEIAFEPAAPASWEEIESCLEALRRQQAEQELLAVQKEIEARCSQPQAGDLQELLERKQQLRRRLAMSATLGR
jgi:DNA primase